MDMIRSGRARVLVVGGTDSTLIPLCIGGFEQAHALCTNFNDEPERASRPFDRDRSGFVAAEGAAVLVLEDAEFARARGARVYARIAGYGATADAHHMTAPDPEARGAATAIRNAIRDAGAKPTDVVYVNAPGTSTPLNDKTESFALEQVFGDRAGGIPVSSTKSMTGHMGGAAGAMEAIFCALAIEEGRVPPTINLDTPDPECRLDYVPWESRAVEPGVVLSNSFGFGGHNACVALRPAAD
jgi:3-oxoacyl-[acyl-carrier-protein] synthase II